MLTKKEVAALSFPTSTLSILLLNDISVRYQFTLIYAQDDLVEFLQHHLFQNTFKMVKMASASEDVHSQFYGAWHSLTGYLHLQRQNNNN